MNAIDSLIYYQQKELKVYGLDPYESVIRTIYRRTVKDGEIVVDGGAHTGSHTFPLSRSVGSKGQVFAFEPIPSYVEHLRAEVDKRQSKNIVVVPAAISNFEGNSDFNHVRNNPGFSGLENGPILGRPI